MKDARQVDGDLVVDKAKIAIVVARSAAEMPVVTPSAASIDTVKLVSIAARLSPTISGRRNCLQRFSDRVRQIRPRPDLAMKLM